MLKLVVRSLLVVGFMTSLSGCQASSGSLHTDLQSFEGAEFVQVDDMILDRQALEVAKDEVSAQAASGFTVYYSEPWLNGVLPVVFDSAVPANRRQQFLEWGKKWYEATGVMVVARKKERDYITVTYNSNGCYSHVGASRGELRNLNLASNCWYEPTVLHEIGHALGLMHEHQRPDRDSYISINLNNMTQQNRYAFDRLTTMNESESYDFLSIMHYGPRAFSSNGKTTIEVKSRYSQYQSKIGINKISASDRRVIAKMYAAEVRRRGKSYDN